LCTQHSLRLAVARGLVEHPRRDLYVLEGLSASRRAAAEVGGVLSHLSAAHELGWKVLTPPAAVHVTVPRNGRWRTAEGVVLHRCDIPDSERTRVHTRALRTVLDCAASLPFAEALAVADSALRDGRIGREDLLEAAMLRRGPGALAVRRVAAAADDRADNPFESVLRAIVLGAGFTGFVPQQPVRLRGGSIVHVDLGDPALRIAIEADSFAHHGDRWALRNDCRRYDELLRVGWVVIRFAWEHVMSDAPWVGATLLDVVRSRAHTA
jgi:very-short-patch-repair endonuclease